LRNISIVVFFLSIFGPAVAAPEYLLADRTFYVRTDGLDNGSCLADAPGGACATWQAAYNKAALLDFNGKTVTIRAGGSGARSWTVPAGDVLHIWRPWNGWGVMRIVGDINNPANVKLNAPGGSGIRIGGGHTPGVPINGPLFIEGFDITARDFGLRHAGRGDIGLANMRWGPANGAHYGVEWAPANIRVWGPQTVYGSAQQHLFVDVGVVMVYAPTTFIGDLTFQQTVYAQHKGFLLYIQGGTYNTSQATIVGRRYVVREHATIQGDEPGFLVPGSIDGVQQTGGIYIGPQ
jgi:hypothetical protein